MEKINPQKIIDTIKNIVVQERDNKYFDFILPINEKFRHNVDELHKIMDYKKAKELINEWISGNQIIMENIYNVIPKYYFDKKTLDNIEFEKFDKFIKNLRFQLKTTIFDKMTSLIGGEAYMVDIKFYDDKTNEILSKISETDESDFYYVRSGKGSLHGKEFGSIRLDGKNITYDEKLNQYCVDGQWEIPFHTEKKDKENELFDTAIEKVYELKCYLIKKQKFENASLVRDIEKELTKIKNKEE